MADIIDDGRDPTRLRQSIFRVVGMHCANCPVAIERKLRAFPPVRHAEVRYPTNRAVIEHFGELELGDLQNALAEDGYILSPWQEGDRATTIAARHTARDYVEIAAAFVLLGAAALLLQHFNLLPRGLAVSDQMSYGVVFVIGLVASVSSCMAVTGGLLVAVAAKYSAAHAGLTDAQRLAPHLYFNVGRLVSYTLLGGAVGALGSALTLSPETNGLLTLAASAVMILLGLQMLGLVSSFAWLLPMLPKSIAHRIYDLAERETKGAAFVLGASTFFLPCGFTQALQLYVLAKGSYLTGALTMLAFAVGTLPALVSLSAIASLARGAFQKHFLRFAGAAVVVLGLLNIQYGLTLSGAGMASAPRGDRTPQVVQDTKPVWAELTGEVQRITMKVMGLSYAPNNFTVVQGIPVEWWIDGSEAAGCGRMLIVPGLGIQKLLSDVSTTRIAFTPRETGEFAFNCGMGMMTPNSKITVLRKDKG